MEEEKVKTNITPEIREHFNALYSGKFDNFALFSCFVNGEPAAAITVVNQEEDGQFTIVPIFVSVTPSMKLVDHDGVPCQELAEKGESNHGESKI